MAYQEIRRTSYGQNLRNKFSGVIIGVLLFLASFVVLWISQSQTNYARIAKQSTEISADSVATDMTGEFVSVTGSMTSDEKIGDPIFMKPGDYILVDRTVEAYSWEENTHTDKRNLPGGGTETVTTYTYSQEWTTMPENSDLFKERKSPPNMKDLPYDNTSFTVDSAQVGVYDINMNTVTLPNGNMDLTPSREKFNLRSNQRIDGSYIYQGNGSLSSPQINDVRISFSVLEQGETVTVFGELKDSAIVEYEVPGKRSKGDVKALVESIGDEDAKDKPLTFYRVLIGDRETAIDTLKTEFRTLILILMLVGFILNWVGLMAMFGFIPALVKFIPFLGNMSQFIIKIVMFPIALILSLITIGISYIAHNPLVLVIVVVALIVMIALMISKARKRAAQEAPPQQ